MGTTRQKIARAIKEAWFGRDRVRDEEGLSLWTVLGGLLLSALITAFFVIPNLLGARTATQDAAPQHNLQAAIPAAKVLYGTSNSSYSTVSGTALNGAEPTLQFSGTTASTGPHHINFAASTGGQGIIMEAQATKSGPCYYIADVDSATSSLVSGNIKGAGTWYAASTGACTAVASPATASVATNWQTNGFPAP